MQHTLFIADLHLAENHTNTTHNFIHFLNKEAPAAEALYILGDFFELWLGDDDDSIFYQMIKENLLRLSQKMPIFFLHGNRDFLIGKKFAKETGCQLLPEFAEINLYGQRILLLHGDALCTLDQKHMKFRKLTQNKLLKNIFLQLPLSLRRKIGLTLRTQSKQNHFVPSDSLMGIVPSTVDSLMERYAVNSMIHGHIHKPQVNHFLVNNQPAERIVLGSWDTQGCCLKWYQNGKREMFFFSCN
jgi:UDP-2,3-diacylglucosamine hydrolase